MRWLPFGLFFSASTKVCYNLLPSLFILNFADDPLNQFAKLNTFELSPFDQYVEALMYSVSALTGCAVGIIYPSTYMEVILTIIIMVIGATMFAKVFADFGALMYLFSEANIQNK